MGPSHREEGEGGQIMEINTDQVAQQCIDAINKEIKNLKKLNIIVLGKSGVGKSTLINSIFRENFAETGLGRPVTQEVRRIEKNDFPLVIYDTPGFELSDKQQNSVKDEIMEIIRKGLASQDVNQTIHCIWYCINVGGNRTFDESELKWLRDFTESNRGTQVPIIVVLTQSCPKKKAAEMKNLVERENLYISKVVPVLAQDMDFDEEYVARAFGLDTLVEVMGEALPKELQGTLQNLQKVSLESKKKMAQVSVATAVAAAIATGASPIPLSDAALLIPVQVSMIAGITAIFGLNVSKSCLTAFVSSTIGTAGATVLGKTAVSNILKLMPGIGSVAGGAISGTTAGMLTAALGEAYIAIMELVFKGEMKAEDLYSDVGRRKMQDIFKSELKKKRK